MLSENRRSGHKSRVFWRVAENTLKTRAHVEGGPCEEVKGDESGRVVGFQLRGNCAHM